MVICILKGRTWKNSVYLFGAPKTSQKHLSSKRDKLFCLLKLARLFETDITAKDILQDISDRCLACQKFQKPPLLFISLILEENLVFGDELCIDFMFLERKALLHDVNTVTRFSAVTFLDALGKKYGHSVKVIWLAFVTNWCLIYTGYSNGPLTNQGSVITSERWNELTNPNGVQLKQSGIKAHSFSGIEEGNSKALRRIYCKPWLTHPTVSPLYV